MNSKQRDKLLFSVIGKDPILTLLTARFLDLDGNVLIHKPETRVEAQRLEKVMSGSSLFEVTSQEFYKSHLQVIAFLDPTADYHFNLSDGPRNLTLISTLIWNLVKTPLYILKRESGAYKLYTYLFEDGKFQPPEEQLLPGLLTLEEYLHVCVGSYAQIDPTSRLVEGRQEIRDIILSFLKILRRTSAADEDMIGIKLTGPREEITLDLVVRKRNQVKVIIFRRETDDLSRAVEHLVTAGQESYLGPQTNRFLVIVGSLDNAELFSNAKAQGISIISLDHNLADNRQDEGVQMMLREIMSVQD